MNRRSLILESRILIARESLEEILTMQFTRSTIVPNGFEYFLYWRTLSLLANTSTTDVSQWKVSSCELPFDHKDV